MQKHQNDGAILKIVKLFNVVSSFYDDTHKPVKSAHDTHLHFMYRGIYENIKSSFDILRKTLRETNQRTI